MRRPPTRSCCSTARTSRSGRRLGKGADAGKLIAPTWPVKDGYFECAGNGDLMTREKFGDIQLHVEWSEPPDVKGTSQGRGNSGILIMSRYEIQVLDAFNNPTYADGQAGAIYGQWPPLANPARPRGSGRRTTSCSKRRDSTAKSW